MDETGSGEGSYEAPAEGSNSDKEPDRWFCDNSSDEAPVSVEDATFFFYTQAGKYGSVGEHAKYVVNNAGFIYRIVDDYDNLFAHVSGAFNDSSPWQ
jgi:hypothetical protein